ncbi:MAG: TetR/AcrR family transcriptional regulator, partial [Gemmatimonadales bacterium]|nr:TetR/AcrR family transcriptional regulator [Gemmatimonadales bacterium]
WQRRPADRRQEILAAAMLVFGEEGYAKATLAQVARKAGISAATVSHYFGSKAALFEAMVTEEAMDIGDDDPMLLVGADGFRGVLHQLVLEKWQRLNQPGVPELTLTVIREIQDFPLSAQQLFRQLSQRYRRRVEAVLNAGVMAGEFDIPDPHATSRAIGSLLLGAMMDVHFIAECTNESSCRVAAYSAIRSAVDRLVAPVSPDTTA